MEHLTCEIAKLANSEIRYAHTWLPGLGLKVELRSFYFGLALHGA